MSARLFSARSAIASIHTAALVGVGILSLASRARAEPALLASCTPSVVVRGEIVRCTVSVAPPPPYYTLLSRSARSGEHLRVEKLKELHAGSKSSSWEGLAVVSTEVGFVARVGNAELHAHAKFEVKPRQFPRATLADKSVLCEIDAAAESLADPPPLAPGSTREEPVPAPRALSRASLTLSSPDFLLVDSGPNTFWYFVRGPSAQPPMLHILLSRALESGDPFFQLQHGDRSQLFHRSTAWPRCFAVDVEQLREQLRESEGCAGNAASSRVAKLREALAGELDMNQILEGMTLPLDDANARQNPFVRALGEKLTALSNQLLASAQPPPLRVACSLRYPAASE